MSTIWKIQLPQALTPPSVGGFYLLIGDGFKLLIEPTNPNYHLLIQKGTNSGGYVVVWTVQNLGQ